MAITGLKIGVSSAALAAFLVAQPVWADTETRPVAPFHAISFAGSWDVDITVGRPQSVVIEGDKDSIAHVKTEVVDGELRVGIEHSLVGFDRGGKLSAHVTVPSLDGFTRSGSGGATLSGIDGAKLALASNGSGMLKAEGHAADLALAVNGTGSADLADLKSDDAAVTINGSGDAVVQVAHTLKAAINGSGRINYVGEPQVTSAIHGSGLIEKRS